MIRTYRTSILVFIARIRAFILVSIASILVCIAPSVFKISPGTWELLTTDRFPITSHSSAALRKWFARTCGRGSATFLVQKKAVYHIVLLTLCTARGVNVEGRKFRRLNVYVRGGVEAQIKCNIIRQTHWVEWSDTVPFFEEGMPP